MPKLNLIDEIELLVVLGHSNKSDEIEDPMTFDAIVRCRAAGNLYKERKIRKMILLGGGNDRVLKIAESERMKKYLQDSFDVPSRIMEIDAQGTNTITDIVEILKKIKNEKFDKAKIVFLTSDYNVNRVKLVLGILGEKSINVFASERILLESGDYYSSRAGKYFDSEEYQDRLEYESYWIAKTIYDPEYTRKAREELGIQKEPIDYFKDLPRSEMKKI